MATPDWSLFAAVVAVVTLALLGLSRLSAGLLATEPAGEGRAATTDGVDAPALPSGGALAANVAVTHGLVAVVLVGVVRYASVPTGALGLAVPTGRTAVFGVGLGVALYLASEATTAVAGRLGIEYDEGLRELLAPNGRAEWALLLFVSLPLIAVAEELLFRGILVGAMLAGFGAPAWALVVGSSVLFGLGHSAQGAVGVVVTAALGLVLGAAFVWTGSLAAVVLAHYVVDALEFGVREGLLD